MKTFVALIIGVAIGAAAWWFFADAKGQRRAHEAQESVESAARSARDTVQEKLKSLDLRPEDIKEELKRSGKVVRKKAQEAGAAIADATADARTTAAIKTKFLATKDVPAMGISVNTTAGIVTLSGAVDHEDEISRLMALALEVDGVREVISTLQLRSVPGAK
jgi:osmotically-inducible protein OsmY